MSDLEDFVRRNPQLIREQQAREEKQRSEQIQKDEVKFFVDMTKAAFPPAKKQ